MKQKLPLHEPEEKKEPEGEYMVSLIYKSSVITVYQDAIDDKFMPVIRMAGEDKDRAIETPGFDRIDMAVKCARKEIDKFA